MKHRKWIYLLVGLMLVVGACSPDKDDYTKDWVGYWRTNKDLNFPNVKASNYGTIRKVEDKNNKLEISGDLFGISQLYIFQASVSSQRRASISYDGNFSVTGNAYFNEQDTIVFYLTVTQDNKTANDTITAVKIQ